MKCLTVSHSKIKTWRRCHRAYHYKYVEKLRPRRKGRPLIFGSICHEMIEAHANKENPRKVLKQYRRDKKKLFSAEVDEYLQTIYDAESLMTGYFHFYKNDRLKFIKVKGRAAEHEFTVPLCKGIQLTGKIDALAQTPDKRKWLVEHKTHRVIPNEDVRFIDIQTSIYFEVLPEIGIKSVDGVLWDYIRSKAPTVPQLLKSGELSKRKIDTLPHIFLEAVEENSLDPKDYQETIEGLNANYDSYFQRVFMPIRPSLSKQLLSDTIETAKDIAERGETACTRNLSKDCSWCEYNSLCKAELLDMDVDFIKQREFTKNEKKKSKKK